MAIKLRGKVAWLHPLRGAESGQISTLLLL